MGGIAPARGIRTATTTTTIHLREPRPSPGGEAAGGCAGIGAVAAGGGRGTGGWGGAGCAGIGDVASGGGGGTGGWVGSFDTRRLFYHRVSRSAGVRAIAPSFVSAEPPLGPPGAARPHLPSLERRALR